MKTALRALLFVVLALSSAVRAQTVDRELPGHYYLQDVMETGSELLLQADGRFQWMLAYGSLDLAAQGRWHRDGQSVVLVADVPDAGSRPTRITDAKQAWSMRAQQAVNDQAFDVAEAETRRRCDFMYRDDTAESAAWVSPSETSRMSDADLARFDAAIRRDDIALQAALATAQAAMSRAYADADGPNAVASHASAKVAVQRFLALDHKLRHDYLAYHGQRSGREERFAARDVLDIPVLQWPSPCYGPARSDFEATPVASTWTPTFALHFVDARSGESLRDGLPVRLETADGARLFETTDDGWLAIAAAEWPWSRRPTAIRFGGAEWNLASAPTQLTLPADAGPVVEIAAETGASPQPYFREMRLRIDQADLIPDWPESGERGRYHRE